MTRVDERGRSGSRAAMLARIRAALGPAPRDLAAYAGISRDYRRTATLSRGTCLDLFAGRLQHYQVGVRRCDRAALSETIAGVLASRGKTSLLVPADLPRDWLPASCEAVEDAGLAYAELDASEGVLTGCTAAIASTGTIVLCHGRGEGRRALTLVPDYHLCVVFAEQVVESVPEAFEQIAALRPALVTTISGPSATADIEMTRIRGVHGPRTMDVVLAE